MRVCARSLLFYVVLLVTLCVGGLLPTVQAESRPQPSPVPSSMVPSPPELSATAWVLMDANSGKILVEHNADKELPPASLTKMMTAYIVEREIDAGNISGDDKVTISEHAWRTGGSRMFLKPGSQVSINNLLKGVVVQSGNDASVALAEYVAGSTDAFADLMNQQAARMNLKHTHFMNPTGLPHDDHYSSAHDLAVIAQHIIKDYPDHYEMYSQKYFTWNDIRQPNRNRLLWRDPNVDGLKTGHTDAAGYCLVASAKEDGTRLIAVVMGTDSDEARAQETQKLLSYGFRFFETQQLYKSGAVLNKPRVWGGEQDTLRLGVASDVFITVPRGRIDDLNAQLDIRKTINAPVEQGEQLGTLKIKLNGKVLDERPLVALEPVPEGGFFKRLWDSVLQFVYGFFD
ncbi:penicillin-binding protein 6 [Chromohalobacter marismortui]|uniref:serine-type D-Ala-D-Ala carboxypeptidase n=1 Tax=Chromohalobacter marismortui TaxID=42055 RepID=A0A4R7NWV3_9GAMM|nr:MULTISPECIES: D-alanyl-D-alanine carboxypeptidase family protein [Chromohalobacter]MCI0510424.1 D-alanyl-D-alanine carboxypeptidase [Chromohalobacter sp.]MCI0594678.1 D-alanyl-D-alanine carboxypeptidase [Chromohalobacter sp.]TDU25000.1 penicillin-binding protein 6 [Chromohalobacter marismortui]